MKNPLALAYRLIQSNLRERKKAKERSPRWSGVRDGHLKKHPVCEACGAKSKLQVHHRQPFHLHPELELVETNLVTLCMTIRECHLEIGHGTFWRKANPRLEEHLQRLRLDPRDRPWIEKEARSAALAVK